MREDKANSATGPCSPSEPLPVDNPPEGAKPYLPAPYYQDDRTTIYHGDCRELLPLMRFDSLITDPVWPNSTASIVGIDRPYELLGEMLDAISDGVKRMAFHLGCDSNPDMLSNVPLPFFRVCWLEYTRPHYVGRLMYGSDVAYLYGKPPKSKPGQHVIPGRITDTTANGKQANHPCPRKLSHVRWLVKWWADDEDVLCDPLMGSGTTLEAAHLAGHSSIGIEIEERYCEIAANRLRQKVLF